MKTKVLGLALLSLLQSNLQAAPTQGLKVHEWGTFTSVQGSNGETLSGLEYEEEALPSFVHGRNFLGEQTIRPDGCVNKCKGSCCDDFTSSSGGPLQVTQKMETPVLYFYSATPMQVDVTVDFPQGVISQYYPRPTAFLPELGSGQRLEGGQIHYSGLEVLTGNASFPKVEAGNVYAPARQTRANPVRAQGETEKFIFYRGLGDFATALKITSDEDSLTLKEAQGTAIPYMLALNIRGGKASFKELGSLNAHSSQSLKLQGLLQELTPAQDLAEFEKSVGPKLVKALVRSGLYEDEAQSMVNTWRLSYFHTEGMRVLYILSREETDRILPIQISPQPAELVRTLVGRVEVLTTTEEKELLSATTKAATLGSAVASLKTLGRFKEPKLLRLQQLSSDPVLLSFLKTQLK